MSVTNARGQFGWMYKGLCREKCLKPLPAVLACLSDNHLRFCVDRVGHDDWSPILNAIAQNRTLSKITIYSRSRRRKIREKINTEQKLEQLRRQRRKDPQRPVLFTNFLLRCLVDSIAVCLRDSRTIAALTLNGIPLAPKYLNVLCSGISRNKSLTSLSLAKCRIGDTGCNLVLGALLTNPCLQGLNLSSCRLTGRSGTFLSSFMKRRKANLLRNVWNESAAQMETFKRNNQGLQSLVLNENRKLADAGVRLITDVLKDDFWLKSLSLRHCGISQNGVEAIIELLRTNSVLMSMNLRGNDVASSVSRDVTKILRRRQDKGELLPMRKRLLSNDRKKVSGSVKAIGKRFRSNQTRLKAGQRGDEIARLQQLYTAKLESRKRKRKNKVSSSKRKRRLKRSTVLKDNFSDEIDVVALNLRLLSLTDVNDELACKLRKNEKLMKREIRRRLRVERRCRDMEPQLERVKKKIELQNCICSRTCGENQVFRNLRGVFNSLEAFSAQKLNKNDTNATQEMQLVGITETKNSLCTIIDGLREGKIAGRLQRRPHCPNRLRI